MGRVTLRLILGWWAEGTGSGSCPVSGFNISGAEPSGCTKHNEHKAGLHSDRVEKLEGHIL
jgi:hypothetical protein